MVRFQSIFLLLVFCLTTNNSQSQQLHTNSAKALKAYREGKTLYDFVDYQNAEKYFKQAVETDKGFYEAYMMLGELLFRQARYGEAAENYRNAVNIDSLHYKPVYFQLAEAEIRSGDYLNALLHYKKYIGLPDISQKNRAIALKNIINCQFALEAIKKPVPFNPVSIGNGINTGDDEYWPSITADGQTIMFTRQGRPGVIDNRGYTSQEDFYISTLSERGWENAYNAGPPLNTRQNEGAQALSSDGSYMYFTACERPGGMGSCDIFFSSFSEGKWSVPVNLGPPVNTSYWESQPSVSSDGKMLFFSSSRPGGEGGKDLWYSVFGGNKRWTNPVNMGKTINTNGDEMSPFIHFDGKTLYFSSDGKPGMGGFDIYMTRMNSDTTWSEPHNLGYPINTYNDETGLIIESAGEKAFFSSRRDKNTGKDIYYFNLHELIRPDPVAYLKGKVYDKESGKLIKANYELINLSTGKNVISSSTDGTGNFIVCLPSGFNYGLNVSRNGYLFYSENFMFTGKHTAVKPLLKQIMLSPLKVGEKMLLANVFYSVDSWQLEKESLSELNKLLNLLIDNPELKVSIGGYTDSTGTDQHNIILSEKRAMSVVKYLVEKGVSSGRLKYRGYGNAFPIADNVTDEGRRLNRRTEVEITEYNR